MNLVKYFDDVINEYDFVCKNLNQAIDEENLEKAINGIIDYIFKYPNTQSFDGINKLTSFLENIVNFCSSNKYTFEQLVKYKNELIDILEEFKDIVIKNNSIKVVFQNDILRSKYQRFIKGKFLNESGNITIYLHGDDDTANLEKYSICVNIEECLRECISKVIPKSMKRETLHLMYNLNKIKDPKCNIKNFITGSSYSLYGIDNNFLKEDTLNASMLAQDLYLSSKIIKIAVENNNIENCVLAIAPYNFHLDISSIETDFYRELFGRVYYNNLKDKHNSNDDLSRFELKGNLHHIPLEIRDVFNEQLNTYILKESFFEIEHFDTYFNDSYTREHLVSDTLKKEGQCLSLQEKFDCMKTVSNTHNKFFQYKNAEKENKQILKDLLLFLDKNNVKLTLVVFPKPKLYRELLNPEYKKFFDSFICELSSEFEFNLIDLYSDNRFEYSDFADGHHINSIGAIKSTSIVKSIVNI